jgi:hypothetical protein
MASMSGVRAEGETGGQAMSRYLYRIMYWTTRTDRLWESSIQPKNIKQARAVAATFNQGEYCRAHIERRPVGKWERVK